MSFIIFLIYIYNHKSITNEFFNYKNWLEITFFYACKKMLCYEIYCILFCDYSQKMFSFKAYNQNIEKMI